MASSEADRDILELLDELGFGEPLAQQAARSALEAAGLTHARKRRISREKLERVRSLLACSFARCCPDPACRSALRKLKPAAVLLPVSPKNCENCDGSDNLKAMRRLARAADTSGLSRVVIVGGSPSLRGELERLKPPSWQLRLIDGTERRTQDKARADLEWADLVLIWGSSELDHRVSRLYTDVSSPLRQKVVVGARRGIAALLNAGADHLERSE
jgi:hypothetical protein